MISIVGWFERMVKRLVGGIVRTHEQILHVFHAGTLEPVKGIR